MIKYSTRNEGKFAERLIKTLKANIYKKLQVMIENLVFLTCIK